MRMGVVGYGKRTSGLIKKVFCNLVPDLRIAGVIDPDEPGVRARLPERDNEDVVFYKTLDEMVRRGKLDALFIGTRCNLHASYAAQAAGYDIPLFLEKPVAISMAQATRLEKAFENSRCEVVVGFGLKASPLCRFTREKIASGAVGEPVHIMAWNYVTYGTVYWEQEYRNYDVTGGLFLQKATHDMDYMAYLMDSPVVRIGAMGTFMKVYGGNKPSGLRCAECKETRTCLESPENRAIARGDYSAKDHLCLFSTDCGSIEKGTNEDASSAVMEFASGAHGIYPQVFFSKRDAAARGATISGYMGTVEFDWYENQMKHIRHHSEFSDTVQAGAGLSHFGGDLVLGRNFVNIVRGREKSIASIWDGIQSVYMCLAARESAYKGRFVKVRQAGSV